MSGSVPAGAETLEKFLDTLVLTPVLALYLSPPLRTHCLHSPKVHGKPRRASAAPFSWPWVALQQRERTAWHNPGLVCTHPSRCAPQHSMPARIAPSHVAHAP